MEEQPHHVQQDLCSTRPLYRQGRKLTAVKVYTAASESRHLLIFGVPDLKLRAELKSALVKFGVVEKLVELPDYPNTEDFTKVYHVQYQDIKNSRYTKRKMDATSFYGGVLHICYAPEMETVEELLEKLELRKIDVLKRLKINARTHHNKHPATSTEKLDQFSTQSQTLKKDAPVQKAKVYGPQLPPPRAKQSSFIPRQVKIDSTKRSLEKKTSEFIPNKKQR